MDYLTHDDSVQRVSAGEPSSVASGWHQWAGRADRCAVPGNVVVRADGSERVMSPGQVPASLCCHQATFPVLRLLRYIGRNGFVSGVAGAQPQCGTGV